MSSKMPPIPPASRSNKGPANSKNTGKQINAKDVEGRSVKEPGKHHNADEEGETGNIKQNTTNKGFYRGRRV